MKNNYFWFWSIILIIIVLLAINAVLVERKERLYLKEKCSEEKVEYKENNKIRLMYSYITKKYKYIEKQDAAIIANAIIAASLKHNVPEELILSIIETESSFNNKAESSVGAIGLMQIMYSIWAKEYNILLPEDLHDINFNIDVGTSIIRHYLDKNKGNLKKALQNYNGSKGSEYPNKIYASIGKFTVFHNYDY